ncbi:metallophosphoesterase [Shinella sp. DD12]|uniref:metallophosphoesterase n=1 Tax=Shinella sp. DD12 TaxID=1410620 RepID=UPI0003C55E64|nr:metallophosphoesterase [Shinella sp. DD12]EYR81826.1 metallophosphoesterase [Shinella sp. DD12]
MTARNIWFISDTHFGHNNILGYCRPQFANLEEMEQTIIARWNAAVKPQDLVYHLGDFAWKTADAKRVRPLLNGSIRLVVGNHDDIPSLAAAGLFQRIYLWKQFREIGFTASHIPMRLDQLRHGAKNLHGHVHGDLTGLEPFHRDVSVESTGFWPVHWDDVVAWAAA